MDTVKTSAAPFPDIGVSKASSPMQFVRERRAFARYLVEGRASIVLIKSGSVLSGDLLNLSLGGCRIHCRERFSMGIYTRVEAEFYISGMSFRLAGVIQAIHDHDDVGIRFLDMSARKREQIEQLIQELKEMLPKPIAACEGAEPIS